MVADCAAFIFGTTVPAAVDWPTISGLASIRAAPSNKIRRIVSSMKGLRPHAALQQHASISPYTNELGEDLIGISVRTAI